MKTLIAFLLLASSAFAQQTQPASPPAQKWKSQHAANLSGSTFTPNSRFAAPMNAPLGPQNYNAAGNRTWETGTNDIDALYQAELLATSGAPNHPQVKVHGGGLTYIVNHANALINLPYEYGDYLKNLSGSGAFAQVTIDLGKVTRCSVSGGSGYVASSYLPLKIFDRSYQGTGATAYVTTNASGVPNGCAIMTSGMNYPSTGGVVTATVLQAGADGATGTIALTSGTFAASGTVTTGGSGFAFAPSAGVPVGASLVQCTSYPSVTTTVSSGQVATIASTAGSGCTYKGNATATVPVCVGACVKGAQATNLVPLTPNQLGCGLPLRAGVDLDLEGGSIIVDDVLTKTNLNEIIPICDATGDQAQSVTIENGFIYGMVGVWLAGAAKDVHFKNIVFEPRLIPNGTFISQGATGSSLGVYMPSALQNVTFDKVYFNGNGGVVCGGVRSSRTGANGGTGSIGGNDISLKTKVSSTENCDGLVISDSSMYSWNPTNTNYTKLSLPPIVGLFNSYSAPLDTFFEQYVWQSQYSNLKNPEWNYAGTGSCPTAITPQPQRDTDFKFGNVTGNLTTNPNYNCYRGVTDMLAVVNSRYGYISHSSFSNIFRDSGYRPLIVGSFNNATFRNIVGRYASTRSFTDPYIPSSAKYNGAIDISSNITTSNTFTGVFNQDTTGAVYTNTLGIFTNTAANWGSSTWTSITPVGSQPVNSAPGFLNGTVTISFGTVNANTCSTQNATVTGISLSTTPPSFVVGINSPPGFTGNLTPVVGWVSNTNTITLKTCNVTTSNISVTGSLAFGYYIKQ